MSQPINNQIINNIQSITANLEGVITHSEGNVFTAWDKGDSLYDIHPFFEILKTLKENEKDLNTEQVFPCVHLNSAKAEDCICDVTITLKKNEFVISVLDYTRAYTDLNKISQQRNESVLLSEELKLKNKLLVEKENFKNSFIANINHEITAPLTSIQGFVELLENTELSYEQEELTKILKKETSYIKRLFKDMLDLSKIETGSFRLHEENINLIDLVASIKASYTPLIEEKALEFTVTIDPKIEPLIYTDKTRLYQIISNLLNNAIKYTDQGAIKLNIKREAGKRRKQKISIWVADTGIGIEEKDHAKIFEAFNQVNEKGEGSGLGLHVVQNLVNLLGGKIKVESSLDSGSTFKIDLNFKKSAKYKDGEIPAEKNYLAKLNLERKYRVLLVENKLNTQYLVMKFLLQENIFFVDAVTTAEQALKSIENRKYDLIVTDLKLPELSGFQLAERIRNKYADAYIKDIAILAISGLNAPNIKNKCAASGIDSFLPKPFSQKKFINKAAKLLYKKVR